MPERYQVGITIGSLVIAVLGDNNLFSVHYEMEQTLIGNRYYLVLGPSESRGRIEALLRKPISQEPISMTYYVGESCLYHALAETLHQHLHSSSPLDPEELENSNPTLGERLKRCISCSADSSSFK